MKLMDYDSSFSVHLLLFWCTEKEQIKKLIHYTQCDTYGSVFIFVSLI